MTRLRELPLLGLMRDELAIAGQTPDALKTPATPSWLIRWSLACNTPAVSPNAPIKSALIPETCSGWVEMGNISVLTGLSSQHVVLDPCDANYRGIR